MNSLLYRFLYGFEMSMAYLAGQMGDTTSMHNHINMADRFYIKWWKSKH